MQMKIFSLLLSLIISTSLFAAEVKTVSYVLKTAKDKESVVLEGKFTSQIDDDEFIFEDATGKIKVGISKKNTDIQPMIESMYKLDGAKVKLKAVVDKEMFEETELDAIRIKVLVVGKDDF